MHRNLRWAGAPGEGGIGGAPNSPNLSSFRRFPWGLIDWAAHEVAKGNIGDSSGFRSSGLGLGVV